MAINVADNFSYKGSKPLDARITYATVAAMAGAATADLYDGCFAYVKATGKYYSYDSSNTTDPTTGKWREYSSGGGGSTDTEIIADDFDPTESYAVGEYVVYEGTLYKCTTAHTGDWDASNFDDTQVMAEMPTPMPAADMSEVVTPLPSVMSRRFKYSTEEQVVGTWIDGKPVYELTCVLPSTVSIGTSNWTTFSGISTADWDLVIGATCIKDTGVMFPIGGSRRGANNIFEAKAAISGAEANVLIIRYTKTTDEWEVV